MNISEFIFISLSNAHTVAKEIDVTIQCSGMLIQKPASQLHVNYFMCPVKNFHLSLIWDSALITKLVWSKIIVKMIFMTLC